jgi:hypothetical protein
LSASDVFHAHVAATRESILALIEAAMPVPLSAAELDDVATESRAIH